MFQHLRFGTRMPLKQPVVMLIAVFTLALGIGATTAMATDQLIPRRLLFADEDKRSVRLSPDGKMLSYLAPVDGADAVWLCPADDTAKAELLFKQPDAPVLNLQWAYTSRQLVYLKPVAKEVHIFVFDLANRQTRDLTPETGGSARIEKLSPAHPEEILIGLNGRDPKRFDLHRINLRTGETKLVLQNEIDDHQRQGDHGDHSPDLLHVLARHAGSELQQPDLDCPEAWVGEVQKWAEEVVPAAHKRQDRQRGQRGLGQRQDDSPVNAECRASIDDRGFLQFARDG